jgi:hypothetical protein
MPFITTSAMIDVDVKVDADARPVCSKRSTILALASGVLLAACGVSGGTQQQSDAGLPALPVTNSSPAIPSTTTPVRLAPLVCVGGAVEVAERMLIERRRGVTAVGCGDGSRQAELDVCWSRCDDDQVFVDFDLNTTSPGHSRPGDDGDGDGETVAIDYAARYATEPGGTTTAAETLVLTRSDPTGRWVLTNLEVADTSAERTAATATMETYFAALRAGDYPTAAGLMLRAESVNGRDDLGRLVDEGFLTGTSLDEIADALAQWCESGAECTATPELEIEVTATHSLRAIATYQVPTGTFETTFLVDGSTVVGLPIKVG